NCITTITEAHLKKYECKACLISIQGKKTIPLAASYDAVAEGKPLGIMGSAGFLEISVNRGSASDVMKLKTGDWVKIQYQ
ncbi:MAG TPA: SAM hydroxide adenosyltransferase, partial [Chitinivibrionales bacterium]